MTVPAGSWTLPDGSAVGSTITLQPLRSVGAGHRQLRSPPSPPYYAASGIDWRAETPVESYLGDDSWIFADGFESGDTAGAWSLTSRSVIDVFFPVAGFREPGRIEADECSVAQARRSSTPVSWSRYARRSFRLRWARSR